MRGLGNGRLLPAGPLREPSTRLDEVDFIVANGGPPSAGAALPLRPFDLRFELRPRRASRLDDGEERDLAAFAGRRVWAVAGIGHPARFIALLSEAGIEPEPVDVPDHGSVPLAALREERDWPILMTAKDAVKYSPDIDLDAWCVPVDVAMHPSDEAILIERLRKLYD